MTSEDDAQRFSYICTYYLLPGVDSNTPVDLTGPFFFSVDKEWSAGNKRSAIPLL